MLFAILMLWFAQIPTPPATPTLQPLATVTLQCSATGVSAQATYQWQKIEGPADTPFTTATARQTNVSFIDPGTYLLRCVVQDPPKLVTWGDWALVVGANYVFATPPTSSVKVQIVQVPPPDVTDKIPPVITKVTHQNVQLTPGQTITVPATQTFVGLNVTASDNTTLQSAQLVVDNSHIYNVATLGKMPPAFNLWWLDNPLPFGTHTAIIRVYDSSGNSAEFALKIVR